MAWVMVVLMGAIAFAAIYFVALVVQWALVSRAANVNGKRFATTALVQAASRG